MANDIETTTSTTVITETDRELLALSDGRIWEETVVVREILHYTEAAMAACYEIGRRLRWTQLVLDGRESFSEWCEKNLRFTDRNARHYIQVYQWLADKPRLMAPAARAGIKKTLLLTTLTPDQLERAMEEGLPQGKLEDFDALSYVELKRELEALKREAGHTMSELAGAKEELTKAKVALADMSGALDVTDEDELARLADIEEHMVHVITLSHAKLVPLAERMARGELSPAVAARLVGLCQYLEVLVRNTTFQTQARTGEGHWDAAIMENLEAERCMEDTYQVPAAVLPGGLTVVNGRTTR